MIKSREAFLDTWAYHGEHHSQTEAAVPHYGAPHQPPSFVLGGKSNLRNDQITDSDSK